MRHPRGTPLFTYLAAPFPKIRQNPPHPVRKRGRSLDRFPESDRIQLILSENGEKPHRVMVRTYI